MLITIDTSVALSETDLAILALLTGEEPTAAPAPARKTTPAKKTAAKKAAAAPEPEEEDGPTLDDAVARATELVGEQRTDEVKAALATLKAKRVSELKGAQIAEFLELVAGDAEDDVV